ncbi:sugar ABC transporter ATP-binding protein [Microbacterium amylolyticum]|uniref:Simple sugar transport system ATP-binding protein n=1 Tax=Microbacterium amylolyticum TaxID=936337 RepID=A0ABS4ZH36_9MICO|nr:sugar ABC transporter ATP-binding protein [Microbacterium amylolyticum]MBP2436313.1 simple sugar transport system ATP-binding protein [Microbacterium amylolyticum]
MRARALNDLDPVVELIGASVSFPGTHALDDVHLTIRPGEVHALMGENGAGKSTIIRALTGVVPLAKGAILVDGLPHRFHGPADAAVVGISAAFQEVSLVSELSIAENVMLGHEVRGKWRISWRRTRVRAREILAELGLGHIDVRLPLSTLSPPDRQVVSIARAMVNKPRVLLLDEPTSSLEESGVARLFGVIRRLRDQGVAIVYVSHFLEQVFEISDRMTVLRDGRLVDELVTADTDRAYLISRMMGREIEELRAIGSERREHRVEPEGDPVLLATGIGRRGSLRSVDLELYEGEIVGVAGLRGSGRTELARLIGGADLTDTGQVCFSGAVVSLRSPRVALRNRIALSAEDRTEEGLVLDMSVRENIVLSLQAMRGWRKRVGRAEQDDIVRRYVDLLRIGASDLDAPVRTLSGGNQQKVMLARLLAIRPRVLVLDEPTKGVDIAAKVELQRHIARLVGDGVSVVFISSEIEETIRLSDRIVVMKDREKIGEISNGPAISVDTVVEMIAADSR